MEDKFVYTVRMFMEDYNGFDWSKTIVFTFKSGKKPYFYDDCWKQVCEKYLNYPIYNWTHNKDVMIITVNDDNVIVNEKIWFPVILSSYKHGGGLYAAVYDDIKVCPEQPRNEYSTTICGELKRRYYGSFEEADRVAKLLNSLSVRIERKRSSVTQGECAVYINDVYITNFADEIVLVPECTDKHEFFGDDIGGWMSSKSDATHTLALFWHPKEELYHFNRLVCEKLNIAPNEWI